MDTEKTIGELRVRTSFNPSNDSNVEQIKQKTAELINLVNSMQGLDPRLCATAMTAYESAAMWAVKLATSEQMSTGAVAGASMEDVRKELNEE